MACAFVDEADLRHADVERRNQRLVHALRDLTLALDGLIYNSLLTELEDFLLFHAQAFLRLLVILFGVFVGRLNFRARRIDRRIEFLFDLVERFARLNHAGVFFLVAFFERRHGNLLRGLVQNEPRDRRNVGDKRKRAKVFALALVFLHKVPLCRHCVENALVARENRVDFAEFGSVNVVDLVERNRPVDFAVFHKLFVKLLYLRLLLGNLCAQFVD